MSDSTDTAAEAPPAGAPPRNPARDEAARQVIALAGGLVFMVAAVLVERAASDPDFARTLRMRAALAAEAAAMRVARTAARIADLAHGAYRAECAG